MAGSAEEGVTVPAVAVNRLPEELLSLVFSVCKSEDADFLETCELVCRKWRTLTDSNCCLWSSIDFRWTPSRITRHLQRSGNAGLVLLLQFHSESGPEHAHQPAMSLANAVGLAVSERHRWRTLRVSLGCCTEEVFHNFLSLCRSALPYVQDLHIHWPALVGSPIPEENILGDETWFNVLSSDDVILRHVNIPWAIRGANPQIYSRVRRLSVSISAEECHQVVDMFNDMQQLESFSCTALGFDSTWESRVNGCASLPCLSDLSISFEDPTVTMTLCLGLLVPSLQSFSMCFWHSPQRYHIWVQLMALFAALGFRVPSWGDVRLLKVDLLRAQDPENPYEDSVWETPPYQLHVTLALFKALETLIITGHPHDVKTLLVPSQFMQEEPSSFSNAEGWPYPKLKHLAVNFPVEDLITIAQARAESDDVPTLRSVTAYVDDVSESQKTIEELACHTHDVYISRTRSVRTEAECRESWWQDGLAANTHMFLANPLYSEQ
ncbi:hypothetical protein OE88DRAFT_200408 [Heliocybe sulcata]|uniref:F-box domain-containing protein n=1 Tax=Heliocybe sulcata TaxID=5364 RepID=A0A5C3N1P2_9AGAM|nr:hypothetical protein OE88DRAFT_200408 [Heliocybe sulcata]